jgi:polo-like kinase 1
MHKNKIIHRDLKLGNLFISENMEIKIGDFGLATNIQYEGERKHTICGTPNYIAPEILEGKSVGHSYEVDFWAIGVIIYTLIIGRPPFETEDVKETYKKIQDNNYNFPNHIYISNEAKDLIEKILIMNPSDRLNLEGMRNHPFMNKCMIPKSMPQYTATFPPNSVFYRKLKSENIKNITDLSTLNDSYEAHYENLLIFSKRNLVEINRNNLISDNLVFDKNILGELENLKVNNNIKEPLVKTEVNKGPNLFLNKINNSRLNITQSKESHRLVNVKTKVIDFNYLVFIDEIVDYSKDFGYIYKFNKHTIGIYFNDKSNIFKEFNSKEFIYLNKKSKNVLNHKIFQKFNNLEGYKDIPTEIKNKFEILKNYENYANSHSDIKNKVKNYTIFIF